MDAFNLVLDALAEKSEYRSRITIIAFGRREDGKVFGRHWLAYAGDRQGHRKVDFDENSIAAKVVSGEKNSPCFTTLERANQEAEQRQHPLQLVLYLSPQQSRRIVTRLAQAN